MKTTLGCDNQATISWETKGVSSQTKHSKHIEMQFFFGKDCVDHGEVNIECVNAHKMWADLFTKPLQGPKFICFRKSALNLDDKKHNWETPEKDN